MKRCRVGCFVCSSGIVVFLFKKKQPLIILLIPYLYSARSFAFNVASRRVAADEVTSHFLFILNALQRSRALWHLRGLRLDTRTLNL